MIAVTGASGQLGRLTMQMLLARVDASRVVALSRTPAFAAQPGVSTRLADFDRPEGLVSAFDGVQRLLLVSTNTFDATGRRAWQQANAVRAAVQAGVEHVVYTSIAGAGDPTHPAAAVADHRATETLLARSGLDYTVLGNSMYTQLILAGLDFAVGSGVLLDNTGDGATSYVSREDCAAVAAAVLAHGGHRGERLEVTGPRAVTQTEIASLITEFTGSTVRYVPISDECAIADLVAHGMTDAAARRFVTFGEATRAGYTSVVSDVVERITGRRATSVADVLAAHCATRGGGAARMMAFPAWNGRPYRGRAGRRGLTVRWRATGRRRHAERTA